MTRRYVPRERYEYRVRYRRAFGQERTRAFARLSTARRFVDRLKHYESPDPLFSSERLLYAEIDRRPVGEWDRTWEDDRR